MLDRNRQHDRRRNNRRRHHARRRVVFWLLTASILIFAGCHRPDWQEAYSEAEAKFRAGDSDLALQLIDGSESRDPFWTWKFRILKAEVLIRKHAADEAQALLAPEVSFPHVPHELVARKEIIRAHALCNLEKTAESKRLIELAEREIPPGDRATRAELELVLGNCAFATYVALAREHPETAATHLGHAQQRFEAAATAAHGADKYMEARALGAVGFALMQNGEYDEATEKLLAAAAIADSPFLREGLLGDLGECYQWLGDWKMAASFSRQAEELASGIKDAKRDRAIWLIDLGREHYSQLEYGDAAAALSRALSIAKELNDRNLEARCLVNLVVLAFITGNRSAAEQYIAANEALRPEGEQRLYLLVNKAELARLNGKPQMAEDLLLEVSTSSHIPHLLWQSKSDLASLYVSQSRFAEAERMFREAIATAEKAFTQVSRDEFRISFLDQEPFYDEYVRFLVARNRPAEALNVAERGRSPALAAALGLKAGAANANITRIRSSLAATHQVALAYWLSPTESYVWVITPSLMKVLKLPPEMEIVRSIDAYSQQVLEMGAPEESGLGQKLYEMLVAPAEKYIPRGSRVIIVPHRRLYKLNFETLISPRPKPHFWVEDVCIQNASFLAVLENPKRTEPHYSKDLLLMGAPVEASKDFPGLAHAPQEIEKVATHFPQAKQTVIQGTQATPAAYRSSDPRQFRFFHFVTHGTASDTNPLDSAIILSPSSDGYKLYARDIIKTRINPELVTISTCYGVGTRQYSGEGLVGLAWAFMRVGAHQVVAALWEVDDAANADLMDQFYGELTRGKNAAAALRDGKLAMLHSTGPRKRPYYWASLQLYTGP